MELTQLQNIIYCGIDISKDSFDYCFLTHAQDILHQDHLPMTRNSFDKIFVIAKEYVNQKVVFLMESTSSYHRKLQVFLEENDYKVYVVMPLLVSTFTRANVLRNTKTDKKDALSIAEFGVTFLKKLNSSSTELNDLRNMLRTYQAYVKDLTRKKVKLKEMMTEYFPEFEKKVDIFSQTALNFLSECCTPATIKSKQLRTLDKLLTSTVGRKLSVSASEVKEMARISIGTIDDYAQFTVSQIIKSIWEIKAHLKAFEEKLDAVTDELFREEKEIISSVKGIGKYSAMCFLIEITNINKFNTWRQLCAFAGLDPGKKESGTSIKQDGKISKKGNKHLRCSMYLMAQKVVIFSPRYKKYYKKKRAEGKSYKEAIVAVSNKLIKLLFSLLKNGTYFEEDYEEKLIMREAG